MNLLRSDEPINKAWIREGTIFFEWKGNESIEEIHGLYERAELVQYSYETVIKCFETKLTNRTNPAYEIENRREKLHNLSNKTRFLKTEIIASKTKLLPTDAILSRLSDSILSIKFLWHPKSSILVIF